MKATFVDHVFLQCMDSSLSSPQKEYFFGPIMMLTSTVAVPTVVEYDAAEIELTEYGTDHLNDESNGILRMRFNAFRTRSQGLTSAGGPDRFKRKPNGAWETWTDWDYTNKGKWFEIGYLKRKKDNWSMEVGPGLQPAGWLGKMANDVSDQGAPFYLTVDKISAAKPSSCDAMFAMFPRGAAERAPGHSLGDSYQQTKVIAEDNASKGISDTVDPSYVRRLLRQIVCYSIDETGTCHVSGESLWVPGDLEQPLDWDRFLQTDVCSSPQFAQVEVVLKGPPTQVNRTRIIRCTVASHLAHVRKDLIDLGVKDTPPSDSEATRNPSPTAAVARNSVASQQMRVNGVIWANGDPTYRNGNITVKLSRSLIVIEQGSTSARFYITPQGTGIILVPPPDARSRETYNTQTHQYASNNPSNADATGNYLSGPPPGMMRKLSPFAQMAEKAINQAKQTPDGSKWDDEYFRNILKPYDLAPASSAP